MEHSLSFGELFATILALGLTGAFSAWAAVVKRAAEEMGSKIDLAVKSLDMLREEIHRDRIRYEKRFVRLESKSGLVTEE